MGMQTALEWLTRDKKYTPKKALAAGAIHALATDLDDLISQAKAWIKANPEAKAPWDAVKRFKIPGGGPTHPKIAQMLASDLPAEIACAVTAEQVAELTGVDTGCGGITYPAGGWLCPQQLTAELLALAAPLEKSGYGHYLRSLLNEDGVVFNDV